MPDSFVHAFCSHGEIVMDAEPDMDVELEPERATGMIIIFMYAYIVYICI